MIEFIELGGVSRQLREHYTLKAYGYLAMSTMSFIAGLIASGREQLLHGDTKSAAVSTLVGLASTAFLGERAMDLGKVADFLCQSDGY